MQQRQFEKGRISTFQNLEDDYSVSGDLAKIMPGVRDALALQHQTTSGSNAT
jgi:hypothetical protein